MKLSELGYTSKTQFFKVLVKSIIIKIIIITIGFLAAAFIFGSYEASTNLKIIYLSMLIVIVSLDVIFGAPKKSFLVNGICTITGNEEDCDENCEICYKGGQ